MKIVVKTFFLAILLFLTACNAHENHQGTASGLSPALTETPFVRATEKDRLIVLISDSHMGYGRRDASSAWYEIEDYKWPMAFKYFLGEINNRGKGKVDLIILGDFLELWQAPIDRQCKPYNESLGCTVGEMAKITKDVVIAHEKEMAALRDFSEKHKNRVHIVPGNHDSALLLADVWKPLGMALGASSGRINLVAAGVWASPNDGWIVVEHGHQIGNDVNRYENWPKRITETDSEGIHRMIRPWGENFVQSLFNAEEAGTGNDDGYPIIDNLGPETAGIRYRLAERGFWKSVADMAEFTLFNLLETSLVQKTQVLGAEYDPTTKKIIWNTNAGRKMGYKLFANALPDNDPFRKMILEGKDQTSKELRDELDKLANDKQRLSDTDIRTLCDQIAIRKKLPCIDQSLGAAIESTFRSRESVLKEHLELRRNEYKGIRFFIYGHTHKYEEKWDVSLTSLKTVSVLNTGAFQRVVTEKGFLRRVKELSEELERDISPGEALRIMDHDKLPPCYTFVEIPYVNGYPEPELKYWINPSEDEPGEVVPIYHSECQ